MYHRRLSPGLNKLFLRLTLLVVCSSSVFFSIAQRHQDSTYSQAEIIEDLQFLKAFLEATHPALYEYQPKSEFDALFKQAEQSLQEETSNFELLKILRPLIKGIGCGHTSLTRASTKEESKINKKRKRKGEDPPIKYLPFRSAFLDDRLFVNTSYDSTLTFDMEVLAIDNKSVRSLAEVMQGAYYISADGINNKINDFASRIGGLRSAYTEYFHPLEDSIQVLFQTDSGTTTRWVPTSFWKAEPINPLPDYDTIAWNHLFEEGLGKKKYKKLNKTISLHQHSVLTDVALLNVNAFVPGNEKLLAYLFAHVQKLGIKELILDLRGNLGGEIKDVNNLLSYTLSKPHTVSVAKAKKVPKEYLRRQYGNSAFNRLMKSIFFRSSFKKSKVDGKAFLRNTIQLAKEFHYDNGLFVLIDHGSFSGSSMMSGILSNDGKATFVGEETGGAMNVTNGGHYYLPKLPNSQCTVRIPKYRFDHNLKSVKKGSGVVPHYVVQETADSYLKQEDLVLKKALELIQLKQ